MRAFLAFLLTTATFILAQGTGSPVLFHLFYIMAATMVVSYLWAWANLRGIAVERNLRSHRAQVGKQIEEHLVVRNDSIWPKLWVEVQDMSELPEHQARFVVSLPSRSYRNLRERTVCKLRGKYAFGPALVRASDPLGLFRFQKTVPITDAVLVYPETQEIASFPLPPAELPGGTATRRRTHHTTSNVSGVRDYAPGDSFNRIHWPSTARHGRLIVKEFEQDPTADLWIILDMHYRVQQSITFRGRPLEAPGGEVRTPASTEEYMVTAAASLAHHFVLRQRRNTGLIGWGQHREVISPEREPRQFYNIMESLCTLRAYGRSPLAEVLAAEGNRFGRQVSLVILTPSPEVDWVRMGLRDLLYSGIYAVAVLVDGMSFGGWTELRHVEAELVAHNVPYYVLRKDEPIGAALSGTAGLLDWRQGARFMAEHFPVMGVPRRP